MLHTTVGCMTLLGEQVENSDQDKKRNSGRSTFEICHAKKTEMPCQSRAGRADLEGLGWPFGCHDGCPAPSICAAFREQAEESFWPCNMMQPSKHLDELHFKSRKVSCRAKLLRTHQSMAGKLSRHQLKQQNTAAQGLETEIA